MGQGSGDQKFIPDVSTETLSKFCGNIIPDNVKAEITAVPPYSLGFPSKDAQSAYYPGDGKLQRDEIARVSHIVEQHNVSPENTRIRKEESSSGELIYKVLQASTSTDGHVPSDKSYGSADMRIVLQQGDHEDELERICEELRLASKYVANDIQKRTLELYIKSFETGDLEIYRDALRAWVRDLGPKVEHIIGFVEPYRDPYGIRAEFEGLVAIADPEETKVLWKLVEHSDAFIRKLPWCLGHEGNNRKGPFEKSLFKPPDFASIHGMSIRSQYSHQLIETAIAYCSSIIFPGINLPNVSGFYQIYHRLEMAQVPWVLQNALCPYTNISVQRHPTRLRLQERHHRKSHGCRE